MTDAVPGVRQISACTRSNMWHLEVVGPYTQCTADVDATWPPGPHLAQLLCMVVRRQLRVCAEATISRTKTLLAHPAIASNALP
jgi:hypothetical protein